MFEIADVDCIRNTIFISIHSLIESFTPHANTGKHFFPLDLIIGFYKVKTGFKYEQRNIAAQQARFSSRIFSVFLTSCIKII